MESARVLQLKQQLDELAETYPELNKLGGRVQLLTHMEKRGINDFETGIKSMKGGFKKGETQEVFDAMDRIMAHGDAAKAAEAQTPREPFITPQMTNEEKRNAFNSKMDDILGVDEEVAELPKEETIELPKFGQEAEE